MINELENVDLILEHITSLLTSRFDQLLLEQLGIGYSQYKVLLLFSGDNIIKQNLIAKNLGQTEASISRQLKIMTSKGLITRIYDPKNSKSKIVNLTLLGQRIRMAAKDIVLRQNAAIFEEIQTKNQLSMNQGLEELHSYLCRVGKHNHSL